MQYERRFIVQERDSGLFLGVGEDGDMDFFRYVNRAFLFEDDESAALTAYAMCDAGGFLIFGLFVLYGENGKVL